ncbi:MAG: TonB-dependent receptor plug domain-containing protein, partial [Pseudomonadota bacterium]
MKKHCLMAQTCLAAFAGTLLVPGFMAPAFAQGVDGTTALEEILVEDNQTADGAASDAAEGAGVTQTNAGPVDGYRAITADGGTRTRTPIKEIPQSIQVIPRSIIEDQQADTITEITRNVSGVQGIERREGTQQLDGDFLVRGQFTETYVNGRIALLDQGLDPIGTISIERIEVIKGPTSALFTAANGAPISGLVNIVEKTPERDAHYVIEGNGGSFNFANVAFDVNQPLVENGDLSFRVTGDIRTSDDFVEVLDDSSVGIFPTLRYDNDRTVVQLRGRYQYQEFDLYPGLPTDGPDAPATGFGFAPDDFAAAFDQPRTELEAFSVDFLIEHQFTDNLSAKFDVGFQNADGDQFSTVTALSPFFFAGAPGELTRLDNVQFAELDLFDVGGEAVYKRDF